MHDGLVMNSRTSPTLPSNGEIFLSGAITSCVWGFDKSFTNCDCMSSRVSSLLGEGTTSGNSAE